MKRRLCMLLSVALLLMAVPMATLSAAAVTYGDVNTDGKISNKDLGLLQQYLNEWDVDPDETAADVNDDGKVNNKDLGLLQQYLNEWEVTLGPKETSIKVLAIGDGYVVDAMEHHLYQMLTTQYDKVELGILYAEGGTIDTHYDAIRNDTATYQFRRNTDGKWTVKNGVAASTAFTAADWDYVVVQPGAAEAGVSSAYGNRGKLTAAVAAQSGDATILWQMGWAFQQTSRDESFLTYHRNQLLMYEAIVETTIKQVLRDNYVSALIPTGTAIQNLRTSTLKDTLNSDGIHLTDNHGDYTAALTWYCVLTGQSADTVTYHPDTVTDHLEEIFEAVNNAIAIPNEVTRAAGGNGEHKSIRLLAVGNSFSVDAMRNHLYEMFEAAGYETIHLGILYIGGCSLNTHYANLQNDLAAYEYYENTNGKWTVTPNYKASDAFALTDWDIVTLQQVSSDSGRPGTYGNLDALVDLMRPQIGDAKLYWQMTWAYQQDANHSAFPYYGNDQMQMYESILATVQEKIAGNPDFDGILPSGTAIQNLRTSTLGDTVTADGYHLKDSYGDYTAALTWYCMLTGEEPYAMCYCPAEVIDHFDEIAQSVENAIATPFAITPCT